jgi:BirA family biotin operon repressor/biotin-[acetyl-CoA-carboxylase] ligase
MAAGGKLAGLLAEVEPAAARPGRAAVALGLGLNLSVDRFPGGIAGVSLHRLSTTAPDREVMLGAWLAALRQRIATLETSGVAGLHDDWRRHAVGLGETVHVTSSTGELRGVAEDIDDTGALLLRTAAGVTRVLAGDVHVGPPPA